MEPHLTLTSRTMNDVDIVERKTIAKGWGTLERFHLRHKRYDGSWSEIIDRDLYTIGEVAAVLPYDPGRDAVLLTEQFRPCGLRYGEVTWLIEMVAGLIEAGATPEETARRETLEEAGCVVTELAHVSTYYSSPGGYGERMHLYAAKVDLADAGGHFGLAHEHEDIRAMVVPFADALAACDDGRIIDGKTLIALNWLARHKADLA